MRLIKRIKINYKLNVCLLNYDTRLVYFRGKKSVSHTQINPQLVYILIFTMSIPVCLVWESSPSGDWPLW